jgi:hypothetical protein
MEDEGDAGVLGEDDRDVDVDVLDEDEIEGGRADKGFGKEILERVGDEWVCFGLISDCGLIFFTFCEKDWSERDREWKRVDEEKGPAIYEIGKRPDVMLVLGVT